jgi:hypothetical protein
LRGEVNRSLTRREIKDRNHRFRPMLSVNQQMCK